MMFLIDPFSQSGNVRWMMSRTIVMMMWVMFTFCVFCTAVFTQPAVTQVEEMSGLVHWTFPLLL